MRVTFWGVRGTIPTPLSPNEYRERLAAREAVGLIGGNTACVSVEAGDALFILDAGSGIRALGNALLASHSPFSKYRVLHILFSHFHWDHIQGLPIFGPRYHPDFEIHLYSAHANLEAVLRRQQEFVNFPVSLDTGDARLHFHPLGEKPWTEISGTRVGYHAMSHPGTSYSYRLENNHRAVIYATDSDYSFYQPDLYPAGKNYFSGADLIIFDAQFRLPDLLSKSDYGHSHAKRGVDLCVREGIKRLALFHHDPNYSDETLLQIEGDAQRYAAQECPAISLGVELAREGAEILL